MNKLKEKMPKNKYARMAISLAIFYLCIIPPHELAWSLADWLTIDHFFPDLVAVLIGIYFFRKIIVALGIQRHNF